MRVLFTFFPSGFNSNLYLSIRAVRKVLLLRKVHRVRIRGAGLDIWGEQLGKIFHRERGSKVMENGLGKWGGGSAGQQD